MVMQKRRMHAPLPLAQPRPQSQKSGQNGGSTPTACLDKAVPAHDTCDSKAHAGHEPYTKRGTMHKQLSKYSACPYLLSGYQVPWNRSPFQPYA